MVARLKKETIARLIEHCIEEMWQYSPFRDVELIKDYFTIIESWFIKEMKHQGREMLMDEYWKLRKLRSMFFTPQNHVTKEDDDKIDCDHISIDAINLLNRSKWWIYYDYNQDLTK
jgi:hypothetical protein